MPKNQCIDLAKKLIDCFNKDNPSDLNHFDKIINQNVKYHDIYFKNKPKNLTAFKDAEKDYILAFPNKKTQIDEVLSIEEDKVLVRWTTSATHKGEYHGIPATNKEVKISGLSVWQFENNQLVEAWQSWDKLGLLEQLGALHVHK